jgi:hypothetical protein
MELPKWAYKAESRVRPMGSIDMVFSLRPLGRVWLLSCALIELVRTATITIVIEFQEKRPRVTHQGEVIEPQIAAPTFGELYEIVRCVPTGPALDELIRLAQERKLFAETPAEQRA